MFDVGTVPVVRRSVELRTHTVGIVHPYSIRDADYRKFVPRRMQLEVLLPIGRLLKEFLTERTVVGVEFLRIHVLCSQQAENFRLRIAAGTVLQNAQSKMYRKGR